MTRPFTSVIFDLDGTLADTLEDIAVCANECAADFGIAPIPIEDYRYIVGDGAAALAARVLGSDDRDACHAFLAKFKATLPPRQLTTTHLYDGVPEMLEELKTRGVKAAIVTNKPEKMATALVPALLPDYPFAAVVGQTADRPRKPDPAGVALARQALGTAGRRALYVGDTGTDMQTGRNSRLTTVGVLWGFRPARELIEQGAHTLVATPAQLLDRVNEVPRVTYLATEHLVLRQTVANDVPAFEEFWRDAEANILDHGTPDGGMWQPSRIARLRRRLARRPSRTMWTILLPPALDVLGYIRLRELNRLSGRGTIAVRLGREWWGRGWAAEALRTLCAHLNATAHVRRLDLKVLAGNTRGLRAYAKADFVTAGTHWHEGRTWCSLEWHA